LVKQAFRESHHVRFFLLKNMPRFFFYYSSIEVLLSSPPQICLFHSISIQPHSSCGLIYTLVLHLTLAHAVPILALCLSVSFVSFWLCLIFIAVCRLSLVAASRGCSSCGAWASHCVASPDLEHGLQARGLSSLAHGLGCSAARGIFPDQGSSPCPLH